MRIPSPSFIVAAVLVSASWGPAAPAGAASSGAWSTFLRPYDYVQLAVSGDTVWCATAEAGLVLYRPSDSTFSSIARVPGGLASNALTSLVFDRGGRLWMGTAAAGVSFLEADRSTWGLLNAFDGLPPGEVTCLALDPVRDSLWIGTDAGVALWNGSEIAGTLPDGVSPSPFASDLIRGIVVKSDSQFIATDAGAYLRRPQGGGNVIDTINAGLFVPSIDAMVTDGIDVFAQVNGAVQRWSGPTRSWFGTTGIGTVYRLAASGGQVFASSNQGVFRWNVNTWQLVSSVARSNGGIGTTFGVGTAGPGAAVYAADRDVLYAFPAGGGPPEAHLYSAPPGNNVLNLYVEGPRLYVNTLSSGYQGGVGRFDGVRWRNWYGGMTCQSGCDTTFQNTSFPFALVADKDGRKWVADWGTGIEILDDTGPVPQVTRPTWSDGFTFAQHTWGAAAVIDSNGGHWFGMDTPNFGGSDPGDQPIGLEYYDSTGAYVANYRPGDDALRGNGKIKALTVDHNRRVWVGHSDQGLQYFEWGRGAVTPAFKDAQPVENVDFRGLVASGDTIWASTTNDVRTYNARTAALTHSYPIPAGPSDLALHPIAVGTDGRVWLGSTNGVRVYNRDGSVSADYRADNSPLTGNDVRAIRVDPVTGAVWIGTAGGLNRFDPFYTPPPPPALARLDVRAYPNPAPLSAIGASVHLSGNATTYTGAVYDLSGRVLRRFGGVADRSVAWDGRDGDGQVVRPGVYFVRVEAGGRASTVRVVLLR